MITSLIAISLTYLVLLALSNNTNNVGLIIKETIEKGLFCHLTTHNKKGGEFSIVEPITTLSTNILLQDNCVNRTLKWLNNNP